MSFASLLRSLATALLVAGLVLAFTIRVVARGLPRVVGAPAVAEERECAWPGTPTLRLRSTDGTVRVFSHSGDEVLAEVRIRVYERESDRREESRSYAEGLVAVRESEGVLEVTSEPGDRPDFLEVYVDYVLRVPRGTALDIESSNGNVWIAQGCGGVRVRGGNADIVVTGPSGEVDVETVNGRIRLDDAPEGGRLRTVNGHIYAHVLGGGLMADTTNGAVVVHLLTPQVDACELTTRNGGITVTLQEGCPVTVDAHAKHGVVRSDFPVDTSQGLQRRRQLRGTIGAGGTRLVLQTLNGNVWIAKGRPREERTRTGPLPLQVLLGGRGVP